MMSISPVEVGFSLLAGVGLGIVYFFVLYHAVRLQAAAMPLRMVVPLHLLRPVLAGAAFWGLAQLGAWALILGLAGFLAARLIAQRLVSGR